MILALGACQSSIEGVSSNTDSFAPVIELKIETPVTGSLDLDNFWTTDAPSSTPLGPCGKLKSQIVNNEPLDPSIYHNVDRSTVSPECVYLLAFWKITDALPNVDSEKELISDLLSSSQAGVEQATLSLSALHTGGLQRLPQSHPARDKSGLESLKSDYLEHAAQIVGARDANDLAKQTAPYHLRWRLLYMRKLRFGLPRQ